MQKGSSCPQRDSAPLHRTNDKARTKTISEHWRVSQNLLKGKFYHLLKSQLLKENWKWETFSEIPWCSFCIIHREGFRLANFKRTVIRKGLSDIWCFNVDENRQQNHLMPFIDGHMKMNTSENWFQWKNFSWSAHPESKALCLNTKILKNLLLHFFLDQKSSRVTQSEI